MYLTTVVAAIVMHLEIATSATEVMLMREVRIPYGKQCSNYLNTGSIEVYNNGSQNPPNGSFYGFFSMCLNEETASRTVVIPEGTVVELGEYRSKGVTEVNCQGSFFDPSISRGRGGAGTDSGKIIPFGEMDLMADDTQLLLKVAISPQCSLTNMSYRFENSGQGADDLKRLFENIFDESLFHILYLMDLAK